MSIRILIDSGNYFSNNDNLGDRAIYQVIIRRLHDIWPDCEIRWITRNAELLGAICPRVSPLVLTEDRRPLQQMTGDGTQILSALHDCDLVLASGGGYFGDGFTSQAWSVLDTLEAGIRLGKPAVILSCGFEPIGVRSLADKMLSVLPRLDLIACREQLQSPAVVRSLGVHEQRVMVAGDEAIELAFEARPSALGNGLGVNVRQADYAGVDAGTIARLRDCLRTAIAQLAAPVVPVPISVFGPSDSESIAALLAGVAGITDAAHVLDTPLDVIHQVGSCRLVVTGSYHAAVFALAQGVSVVALTASPHYRAKMQGLRSQFGAGCRIVPLDRDDTNEALATAIEEGWREAQAVRPELLRAAQRQIAAGRAVYESIRDLVVHVQGRGRQQQLSAVRATTPEKPDMKPTVRHNLADFSLSPEEMETFRKQGFLGPFNAFEARDMERFQKIMYDRVLPTPTPYCPFGLRVRHLDSRTVFDLCSAPAIIGRMASLFGPDLILWNSNLFDKPPAGPGKQEEYPWHQDHYNWNMEPVLNISAWLAITPATLENGCVEFIPQSHRKIIPSALDTDPRMSLRFGGVASDLAYVDETKKVPMVMEAGQFFLFNERVLHHSNPNRTNMHRLGLAIRVTVPIAKVSEPFPCILLSGEDRMGFNQYVAPPTDEPDAEWVASLPPGHEYVFDRPIPGMGWHVREVDGQQRFAWTGLEPEAWIDFRPVGPGDHVLRLEAIHMLSEKSVGAVRLLVNGQPVSLSRGQSDGAVVLEALVPDSVLRVRGDRVRVLLQGPKGLRPCDLNPASTDKRLLGLGVRLISLTPAGDWLTKAPIAPPSAWYRNLFFK